ncbi:hypothetical protein CHS0354_010713 [Potamilus streckersoni]|uniref:Apple domain-containing protein n=1 Tax=Potamilus streckersoni TaxID=2493646 RepID=A0AAE0SQP3_9BIVA|nr:hypothetical protein CHS0354_010713 [Potamilus streckersoni]
MNTKLCISFSRGFPVVEKGYYWFLDTDHLDYLDTSVVTWNKTASTVIICLTDCAYGSSCKSVFYHPQRHLCMASSSYKRALPYNEKTTTGWTYYSLFICINY